MEQLEQTFEQLVEQHKKTIYTVCFMFSKDADEVNDLFQEVLINLWKGMSGFRQESSPSTWVWRVSFNTCITQERKKRRSREQVPLSMKQNLFVDDDQESRQIQMLYKRIYRLKPFDRAIVLLWLEGTPYEEIAEIVGISTSNVSVRLYRIKEELKAMKEA